MPGTYKSEDPTFEVPLVFCLSDDDLVSRVVREVLIELKKKTNVSNGKTRTKNC
jgi:hypothetical protein